MSRYPEEDELEKIKEWPIDDFDGWMQFVQSIWAYKDYIHEDDGVWHVATGGWSGNEEIISTMRSNFVLWSLYWESSHRGGKYIFKTREAQDRE